jgi:hypothetical protein
MTQYLQAVLLFMRGDTDARKEARNDTNEIRDI